MYKIIHCNKKNDDELNGCHVHGCEIALLRTCVPIEYDAFVVRMSVMVTVSSLFSTEL